MTKQYSKLNFKALLLVLIAIVMVAGFTSCKKRNQLPMGDFNMEVDAPTGILDENGNVITNTQYVTNIITVTNESIKFVTNEVYIPGKEIYITNIIKGETIIKTNYVYVDKVYTNTIKVTNTVVDTNNMVSKWHNSFMYKVYAPFAGIGPEGDYKYTNLSYLDTKTLTEMWKRVIQRAAHSGEQFIIRDRTSGRYFYFDKNMDMRFSMRPDKVFKYFVQGIIVQYKSGNGTQGAYAIAGLYKLAHSSATLRSWNDDGVNIAQGYYFRQDRNAGEYDIVVLNPGHVVNGSEYGFQMYHSSYNYTAGTNPYFEQRPEYYMSKITHVTDAWKNWKPNELYDMPFKVLKGSLPNLWK